MAGRTYINDLMSPMSRNHADMTFLSEFSIQTQFDEENCEIEQLTVLRCGAIIVTDMKNALTKAFTMDGEYLDSSKNVGRIFGIVATGDNSFVVCVFTERMLAFYELDKDRKINLTHTVQTGEFRYFGIGVLPNKKLIAGAKRAINVLSPEAQFIAPMTSELDFMNAYHISVSKSGNVTVADSLKSCIVAFNGEGCVEHHIHLGCPSLRGIAVKNKVIFFVTKFQVFLSMINLEERHMTHIHANENPLMEPSAIFLLDDGSGRMVIAEKQCVKIFKISNFEMLTTPKLIPRKKTNRGSTWTHIGSILVALVLLPFVIALFVHVLKGYT